MLNIEGLDINSNKYIYELVNLEYRFLIYNKLGGELFVDAGRLYDFFQNANDFSITWNYGIGFTYDTAIGPIRIEYAIPHTTSLTNNETVHASILYMF